MTREHLDDDTRLSILLSATIIRHRYDTDAAAEFRGALLGRGQLP